VNGEKPIDLAMNDMFGSSPITILTDKTIDRKYHDADYNKDNIQQYIENVLRLESVACKDWLTNKVDRCVGGRVAKQQCAGPLQLPLNDCGVMAFDYDTDHGIATSIGHAPVSALIDPDAGSKNSIAEALTNIIWAPLKDGLSSVSLSANWMWPANNDGEDARLYKAVEGISKFAIDLGINVPTGKDSMSMKQKYPGEDVLAPGTVIISAAAHCSDINKIVEPVFKKQAGSIYYINFSKADYQLGGSSFSQTLNSVGQQAPTVIDAAYFKNAFNTIQTLIKQEKIVAGHDISAGGILTTLLEMCFADNKLGAKVDLSALSESDSVKLLFAENAGIVFQAQDDSVEQLLHDNKLEFHKIGEVTESDHLACANGDEQFNFDIPALRDAEVYFPYSIYRKETSD